MVCIYEASGSLCHLMDLKEHCHFRKNVGSAPLSQGYWKSCWLIKLKKKADKLADAKKIVDWKNEVTIWDKKPDEKDEKYKDRFYDDFYRFRYDNYINDIHTWLEMLKVRYDILSEHSGRWLHFVAVDYPEIKKWISPKEIMELMEKAELLAIYEKQYGNVIEYAIELEQKLEAVRLLWEEAKETNVDAVDLIFRLGKLLEEKQ